MVRSQVLRECQCPSDTDMQPFSPIAGYRARPPLSGMIDLFVRVSPCFAKCNADGTILTPVSSLRFFVVRDRIEGPMHGHTLTRSVLDSLSSRNPGRSDKMQPVAYGRAFPTPSGELLNGSPLRMPKPGPIHGFLLLLHLLYASGDSQVTVDDADPSVIYGGTWKEDTPSEALDKTLRYSSTAGSTATVHFSGEH